MCCKKAVLVGAKIANDKTADVDIKKVGQLDYNRFGIFCQYKCEKNHTKGAKRLMLNNLRHYRERAGLTQAELAEKLGVDRTTINRAETGVKDLPGNLYGEIARVLDVTTDELLGVKKE